MGRNPAVILGDAESVLRLPIAGMRNVTEWTQEDSDVLWHFIQVHGQIVRSRWIRSETRFSPGRESALPDMESFVYVAVYFRQLIETTRRDNLLADATERYLKFVDCPVRSDWISKEFSSFEQRLASNAIYSDFSLSELFEAFMYGSLLIHKKPNDQRTRKRFAEMLSKGHRVKMLFSLDGALKLLFNHISGIAEIVYRDVSHWMGDHNLPSPDVHWHHGLFDPSDSR